MSNQARARRAGILAGWIVSLLSLASAPAFAQSSTAQSVMIDSTMPAAFVIEQNQTWAFNSEVGDEAARNYYTNEWDGKPPTVSCIGQGCTTAPVPGTTSGCQGVPSPQQGKRAEQAVAEKCIFFDGGELIGGSYTRNRQCNYNSGVNRGNWTFRYTYLVAPVNSVAYPSDVAMRTARDLIDQSGADTVLVVVDALIASQAALNNEARGRRTWSRKYNFSLAGSAQGSRVGPLQVLLTGSAEQVVDNVGHELDTNPIATEEEDEAFVYVGNAGENPALSPLLVPAGTVEGILRGLVPARDERFDDFSGNDQVIGQVDFAHMDPVTFELGAGDYTVSISGTVRGVAASLDTPFGVGLDLDIDAETCTP